MAVEFKDYYETLGVARTASPEEIKQAFRGLARRYHPDVAKNKITGEERFKEINEAYEVLGDSAKRRKYDELGQHWEAGGPPPTGGPRGAGRGPPGSRAQEFHFGGTGFSDFFEQFFGGTAGARFSADGHGFGPESAAEPPAGQGADIEGDILVTLDEVLRGTLRPISLQTLDPRTGEAETQSFTVRIPPGAAEGRRLRVPGKGARGGGQEPAGDLYLRVRYAAHPDFHARGADIYHDLDLAPWEAVLGASIVAPSLDGAIKVSIPAGTVAGRQLRVRGHGLPTGRSGERGDLYVVANIQLPIRIGGEERALWEKLARVSHFQPRQNFGPARPQTSTKENT